MAAPLIPEDAPFSVEQRAWLNGFFAGWMSQPNGSSEAPGAAAALLRSGAGGPFAAPEDGANRRDAHTQDAPRGAANDRTETASAAAEDSSAGGELTPEDLDGPWHDSSLSIDERMELAEGKTPAHQLMAAMAQLDCGACGYMCDTYALAIAKREEKDLSLCTPGGRETQRMLKRIAKAGLSAGGATQPAGARAAAGNAQTETAATAVLAPSDGGGDGPGDEDAPDESVNAADDEPRTKHSRDNPARVRVKTIRNLNGEGSAKHTVHVEIGVPDDRLPYRVGDSLGVFPHNDPSLVQNIQRALRAHGSEHVVAPHGQETTLNAALRFTANLKDVTDELVELVASSAEDGAEKARVDGLLGDDEDLLDETDVLDLLRMAPSAVVDPAEFVATLRKLKPRLYSIASSPKAHPGEVHLTVAKVAYTLKDRQRLGVASSMFADRLAPGDTALAYVHGAEGFTVPEDPAAPMVMVGPGTGVAPFRAFLEERQAVSAPGKNWLFFGDQHEETDFLYGGEFKAMHHNGLLSRLSTAFSRDQDEKVYVQHRMLQEGEELYRWLEEGAYFFVCGDAKRMAGDVDKALHQIVAQHGGKSADGAKRYVANLRDAHRYVRDVY